MPTSKETAVFVEKMLIIRVEVATRPKTHLKTSRSPGISSRCSRNQIFRRGIAPRETSLKSPAANVPV